MKKKMLKLTIQIVEISSIDPQIDMQVPFWVPYRAADLQK
jgi:hypothetical protein